VFQQHLFGTVSDANLFQTILRVRGECHVSHVVGDRPTMKSVGVPVDSADKILGPLATLEIATVIVLVFINFRRLGTR